MESESESDKSDSDSELSTANKTFTFDSEQLDSDDEMKTIFEWNYVYHDNIKNSEGVLNVNEYLKHVSSCIWLHIIKKKTFLKLLKKDQLHYFIYLYVNYYFLTVDVSGPIVIWMIKEIQKLLLRKSYE